MITASAGYLEFLARSSRVPIYAVHMTSAGGADLRYTSGTLTNSATFLGAREVLSPVNVKRRSNPVESRFDSSSLTFDLIDLYGQVTEDITAIGKLNALTCTFYACGRQLDFDGGDVVTLFKGLVDNVDARDGYWRVTVRSAVARAIRIDLFDNVKTTLNADISDSATTLVADSEGFQDAGAVVIGFERISYSGTTVNGDGTTDLTGLSRGEGASSAAAHTAGDIVREIGAFHTPSALDHIYDDLVSFLTGSGDKTALDLDSSWVDSTGVAAAKTAIGTTTAYDNCSFEVIKGENAKQFMERAFFQATGAYPVENNMGQIRPVLFGTPDADDFVDTVSDSDIVDRPTYSGKLKTINHVIYMFNAEVVDYDGTFLRTAHVGDATLIAKYGRHTLTIKSEWLKGTATTEPWNNFLPDRMQAFIDRFGEPVPILEFSALMRKQLLEIGDPIYCTFAGVPDLDTGERSIDAGEFEIIGQTMNFRTGLIDFEVLGYPAS